jgi:hypothetical protein
MIVDTVSGRSVEWLRFEHTIDELYDIAILPGVRQPEAIGFRGDAIKQAVPIGGSEPLANSWTKFRLP